MTTGLFIWACNALLLGCLVASIFWKDRSEELARDDEAEELRCQVQGRGVHTQPITVSEAYHHVH